MKTIHDRYLRLISFTIIFFFFTDLYCENLNFSIKSNSQSSSLVSVSFNEGFVGDNTGNNSASNAVYLSSLGWTNIKFTQLSSSGVFVSQGNDIIGEVLITDFNGVVHSINGFIKWRSPSGNSPSTMVFSPSSSHQLITSSGFYDIDSSKYIGLTFIGEALTITGGSVSGNAATNGLLDLLNDYLTLSLSLSPSGPVTVDSITTNDQTPILTGTVILNAGEELSILVDGVEYTESSLNLSISGNSWTLEITSTLQISTYEITAIITNSDGYTLIDSSQQELEITLPDTTPPVITLTGSSTVTLEVGSSYTDLGATALDNYDGNITTEIVTDQTQVDITTLGNYTVTYNVDDSSGNSAVQVTRTVQVVDTTPPVITLTGSSTVTLEVGSSYTDLGATALDNYDGDITTEISLEGGSLTIDTCILGTYTIKYNVVDSSGNIADEVVRNITIFGLDSDNDGIGDVCDNDDDGDGIDDVNQDCDNDGITNSLDNDNSNCSERILMERSYGFSPNGDGINDTWVIQDIDLFPKNVVRVFSRSGKLVFKKNYYKNDWDGVSNQISAMGIKLPAGPYVYIIDLGDNFKPIRGWIYINF